MNKKETIPKHINGKYFARKDNGVTAKWMLTVYLNKKRKKVNLTQLGMFH
jgi:hypothetical protein